MKNKSDERYTNDLDIYPKSDYFNSYYFDVDSIFLENYFWIRHKLISYLILKSLNDAENSMADRKSYYDCFVDFL